MFLTMFMLFAGEPESGAIPSFTDEPVDHTQLANILERRGRFDYIMAINNETLLQHGIRDRMNDFVLNVPESSEGFGEVLKAVLSCMEKEYGLASVYMTFPIDRASEFIHLLSQYGFENRYVDNENCTIQMVYRNGFTPPPATNTVTASKVVLIKEEDGVPYVLGMSEWKIPGLRNVFCLPGGTTKVTQTSIDTAIQEVSEETGLSIVPTNLQRFAICERPNFGKQKVLRTEHYYLCRAFEGELSVNSPETLHLGFFSIEDILDRTKSTVTSQDGSSELKVSHFIRTLIRHCGFGESPARTMTNTEAKDREEEGYLELL